MDNGNPDPTCEWQIMDWQNFGYVCTLTLTLKIWPSVKVMTSHLDHTNVWATIAISIPPPQKKKILTWHDFSYVCTGSLTLEIWYWTKAHETPFGHEQQVIVWSFIYSGTESLWHGNWNCRADRPYKKQKCFSRSCLFFFNFMKILDLVFWDMDFEFGEWIRLDIIQINFDFFHAWSTFTVSYCPLQKLSFRNFLCNPLRYWLRIS